MKKKTWKEQRAMRKAKIIQQQPLPSIKLCMEIEISLFYVQQNGSEIIFMLHSPWDRKKEKKKFHFIFCGWLEKKCDVLLGYVIVWQIFLYVLWQTIKIQLNRNFRFLCFASSFQIFSITCASKCVQNNFLESKSASNRQCSKISLFIFFPSAANVIHVCHFLDGKISLAK